MRIQNILALTDFSTPAEHGLDRAATLAATHGARLRVLYVCETPPLQLADPAARLEQRARQLARRHGVPVTAVIGTGRPLDDCLAEAERADLLVAHGRMHRPWPVPPWRTLLYPLLRRCPCPVLVACRPPQGPYARVLVAVDFSAASRPLVRYAGDVVAFGLPTRPIEFDIANSVIFKGITVHGIVGRKMWSTWQHSDDLLLNNLVDLKPIVTHQYKLEEFDKAFTTMESGE
ncbi:MAG TPA: universal stress protein, partial [Giesbergeria sp.]|nr:universal stress protein [Giesbergeria sp.]